MNKKQKKMLVRIIISLVLVVVFSQLPVEGYLRFGLFMIPYLIIGYDILKKAFFWEIIQRAQQLCFSTRSESFSRAMQ